MPTLKPSILRPIQRQTERLEFADPNQETPWVLYLRSPDDLELGFANDNQQELTARYVDGNWIDESGALRKSPDLLRDDSMNPVIVSKDVLFYATKIEIMQDAPSEDEEYSSTEIMSLIPYYPVAWQAIKAKMFDLLALPKALATDIPPS